MQFSYDTTEVGSGDDVGHVRALAKGDRVLVEGKLRSSTYEKALPVGVDSHRTDESVGNSHPPGVSCGCGERTA